MSARRVGISGLAAPVFIDGAKPALKVVKLAWRQKGPADRERAAEALFGERRIVDAELDVGIPVHRRDRLFPCHIPEPDMSLRRAKTSSVSTCLRD